MERTSSRPEGHLIEIFVGLSIFVLFLETYILLGDGNISALGDLPKWLSVVLLPATVLLGGCLGAVYWRLMGLTGRYVRSRDFESLAESGEDAGNAAMLLVGAIAGVFCGFVLPAALLSNQSDLGAYNTRALALLAVAAGYAGCNAFGNVGRLLSEVLQSRRVPLDATTLRQALDKPLRETINAKLDERFSPQQIPSYRANLNSDILAGGSSMFAGSPSAPVLLSPDMEYILSIGLDPNEQGSAYTMLLQNDVGPSEAEIPFEIEVDADGVNVTPMRVPLRLRQTGEPERATVKLAALKPATTDSKVEGEPPASFIRVAAYCRGSPSGRLLIPFSIKPAIP